MPRPIHFEIPATNVDREIAFYQTVLGWRFQKWEGSSPYWLITTGPDGEPGINGGMLQKRDPAQPCVNTVGVADLDATVALAEKNGGKCVLPKMPVPGIGWLAYCQDPEGNMFGLLQSDFAAK